MRTETEKLQTLKAELETDIEEAVQRTLYEEQPKLSSKYGPLLRKCDLEVLRLFQYEVKEVSPQSIVQDVPGHVVPQIYKNSLKRYDLFTGQTSSATLTTSFTNSVLPPQ